MPAHLVEYIFAGLSLVYLSLYGRDYLRRKNSPPKKAWLRAGLIFAVISAILFYLHAD